MKKIMFCFLVICVSLPSVVFAETKKDSPTAAVEQVVHNFFKSLNEKDSELYLESVANPQSAVSRYLSQNMEDATIQYTIEKTDRVNDSQYEVYVSKIVNGIQYPVIPYDIVLESDEWRLDSSTVVVYDTIVVEKFKAETNNLYTIQDEVVSANENFIVAKRPRTPEFTTFDWRTYLFGNYSADIYSNGLVTIESFPDGNGEPNDSYNWLLTEIFTRSAGELIFHSQDTSLSGYEDDSTTFYLYGYHTYRVRDYNFGGTGKYNVVW